jgi:hypothetical protein
VPITVIWELIDPQSRSILASQFSAGTTPAWYNSLPTDVKSYQDRGDFDIERDGGAEYGADRVGDRGLECPRAGPSVVGGSGSGGKCSNAIARWRALCTATIL